MPKKMPAQKRGASRQDYQTPGDFIHAVVRRFGRLDFDLAAYPHNAQAKRFYTLKDDALTMDWAALPEAQDPDATLWLNPPYDNIGAWASKCAMLQNDSRFKARLLFLVPASVGSRWFEESVLGKADVLFLGDRIQFVGAKWVYPKDTMLCVYERKRKHRPALSVWRWKSRTELWALDDDSGAAFRVQSHAAGTP